MINAVHTRHFEQLPRRTDKVKNMPRAPQISIECIASYSHANKCSTSGREQGMSVRSRLNYGNTHLMASQPGPVNISISKLVESGMTFVEARKHIARATR